nr:hypothetical protein L203_04494 [Cryptococcus depauperatus CBS 7841]
MEESQQEYEDHLESFWVRARFDFIANDASALSFKAGDIIQVFSRLESGWWDGMLEGRRGWFPSNYVEQISEEDLIPEDLVEEVRQNEEGDILNVDDVLRGQWGDNWGEDDFGQLAEEMIDANGDNNDDRDGLGFMRGAQRQRQRIQDPTSMDEFGFVPRSEEPVREVTIKATSSAPVLVQQATSGYVEAEPKTPQSIDSEQGEDAWIPSITPDGQVYYHNIQTGEDSWEIPASPLLDNSSDLYAQSDEQFFASMSSLPISSLPSAENSKDAGFIAPPRGQDDLPYPWIAKLSDDGREWFYHNRLTGQTQKDKPKGGDAESVNIVEMTRNLSLSTPPRPRQSFIATRRNLEEWASKTAAVLHASAKPTDPPTMEILLDFIQDALREILESTVAGSAAEEELSRATDLGSPTGIASALLREEGAKEGLLFSYYAILSSIRDLLISFGYVGPLELWPDMPRPSWTNDLTLVGSIGVLSSSVHSAMTYKRKPESSLSIWSEVLRSAGKLRDITTNLPSLIFRNIESDGNLELKTGKRTTGYLSFPESLGEVLGGQWGFGKSETGWLVLGQDVVIECQRLKRLYDEALSNFSSVFSSKSPNNTDSEAESEAFLLLLRALQRYHTKVYEIDIAAEIDVDGDLGDWPQGYQPRKDDLEEYGHLVQQACLALKDLDEAMEKMNEMAIGMYSTLSWNMQGLEDQLERLSVAVNTAFRALPTLLVISREQRAANEQGLIRGQLGWRSPKHILQNVPEHTRPESLASTASRSSRISDVMKRKTKGLEDEVFLPQYGLVDLPGDYVNNSQSSLPHHRSASSSSTSLAYQESDGHSLKGNRSSILRAFRRNRPGSNALDDGPKSKGTGTSKKLAKLLGEDVSQIAVVTVPPPHSHSHSLSQPHHLAGPPPTQPLHSIQAQPLHATQQIGPPAPPETPWYMMDDYVPGEIIFDDKGAVKAGTLRALVVRLTSHSITDTPFFQAFLLTFRSFTNASELFEHLQDRYFLPPPSHLAPEQFEEWRNKKKWYIQLRVVNALRQWFEKHFLRATDESVLDRVEDLAGRMREENDRAELMSKQLLQLVAKRRQCDPEQMPSGLSGINLSPPAPLVPRVTGRAIKLTDIPPLEIARQLTILEFGLFQNIKPNEFLSKIYQDDHSSRLLAPNVRRVIFTANTMAGWVAWEILACRDVKLRAQIMKIWIQVAVECRNLNNFSSLAAISAGLNSAPISRLRRTKELLSAKTQALKAELDKAMDSSKNFSNYKEMLKTINPPCVPFLGFYLTALTFIEDGNKSFIKPGAPTKGNPFPPLASSSSLATSHGPSSSSPNPVSGTGAGEQEIIPTKPLINFFKRSLSAEILRDIAQYQSQPYRLAKSRVVQDWIANEFDHVEKAGDLYDLSVEVEPREKEEERITRMLHDSVSLLGNFVFSRSNNDVGIGIYMTPIMNDE